MSRWALVIGASSGIGRAAVLRLASDGYDILGVHLDRRAAMPRVQALASEIEGMGRRIALFNANIVRSENRREILEKIREKLAPSEQVEVLVHSIAFGVTKPLSGPGAASEEDLAITCGVMGHDVVHWVRGLLEANLFGSPGRVLAMTSEGDRRAWKSYGPVAAAKCVLESHTRQLAVELANRNITVNCILAGVTDTPALRLIPGSDELAAAALKRNPHGRLTTPEDVANVVSLLCDPRAAWITGSVVHCDGGECVAG